MINFVSAKKVKSKYLLTYSNLKDGYIQGTASVFDNIPDLITYARNIVPRIKETNGARIFFEGDNSEPSEELINLLDDEQLNFYRRSSSISKNYYQTIQDLEQVKPFDVRAATFINGIPEKDSDITAQGYSLNDKDDLAKISRDFSTKLSHSTRVTFRENVIDELENGSRDILLLIAHSDKLEIFLGGEKISLEELKTIKGKGTRKRPRTAYLFCCNSGNMNQTKGIFSKPIESFSEVLISNDMVDSIIAPAHEIGIAESNMVLDYLINNQTIRDIRKEISKKWQLIAFISKHQNDRL